jgi:hypothetical protein
MRAGLPSAIAFEKNSSRAIVADRIMNQILSIELRAGGYDVQLLAGAEQHVAAPAALALDSRSSRLLVLNSATRTVVVISLSGSPPVPLECSFEPARLSPLREKQLYSVSSADGRTAALIRTDSHEPKMLYLPAVQ